jgi:chromosome segregation ATPase
LSNIPYYLMQFAVFVAIALLIGILIGYLIWGGTALDYPPDLQLGDESEAVADLRAQVEAKDGEISRLRKRLKRAHADLEARTAAAVGAEDPQLRELVETRSAEVSSLSHQVSTLHQELERAQADLAEERSRVQTFASGDGDTTALLEQLDAGQQERRRLESEVLALRSDLDSRSADIQAHLADVDQLSRSLDEHAGDLERYREALADRDREIDALRSDISSASLMPSVGSVHGDDDEVARRFADLESQISEAVAAQIEADQRAEHAASALVRAESEATRLRAEAEELRSAPMALSGGAAGEDEAIVARLQAELERSRGKTASYRERMAAAEDESERLAGELAETASKLSRMLGASSEVDSALQASREELERATVELQRVTSASADLDQQLSAARDEINRMSADLSAAQAQPVADPAELTRLRAEADQLGAQLRDAQTDVERLGGDAQRAGLLQDTVDQLGTELTTIRSQHDQQIKSLHLELSDARLRADEAHAALVDLSTEFSTFRDTILRQQTSMSSLTDRLDRARGALSGRPTPATTFAPGASGPDDLSQLPGATPQLVRDLEEFGVQTFEEVGSWDASELARFEELLHDDSGVLRSNGWIMAARRLWEERNSMSWSERNGSWS